MKCGNTGSCRPAIICKATAASIRPGTIEPIGAAASTPRSNMIMPKDRRRRADISQASVKWSAGACSRSPYSTRELGLRSLVTNQACSTRRFLAHDRPSRRYALIRDHANASHEVTYEHTERRSQFPQFTLDLAQELFARGSIGGVHSVLREPERARHAWE